MSDRLARRVLVHSARGQTTTAQGQRLYVLAAPSTVPGAAQTRVLRPVSPGPARGLYVLPAPSTVPPTDDGAAGGQ